MELHLLLHTGCTDHRNPARNRIGWCCFCLGNRPRASVLKKCHVEQQKHSLSHKPWSSLSWKKQDKFDVSTISRWRNTYVDSTDNPSVNRENTYTNACINDVVLRVRSCKFARSFRLTVWRTPRTNCQVTSNRLRDSHDSHGLKNELFLYSSHVFPTS